VTISNDQLGKVLLGEVFEVVTVGEILLGEVLKL
jgi:hypothetical protein